MKLIEEILKYKRPNESDTEREMINKIIRPLGVYQDPVGNLMKRIGNDGTDQDIYTVDKDENFCPVMWSCHTDTVHKKAGRQMLCIESGIISSVDGNCLGADDGAGIWLMVNMIQNRKPGLYVFHRAEECGGIGSAYLSNHEAMIVEGIKFAIAFDRKGKNDIITHQGARTASDEFARSLASELNMNYIPDDSGMFTDTENYTDIIGECSNISVGYESAHTKLESLDFFFLEQLLSNVLRINHNNLVYSREPGDTDPFDSQSWQSYGSSSGTGAGGWESDPLELDTMETLVEQYPEIAVSLLNDMGYDKFDFIEVINGVYGTGKDTETIDKDDTIESLEYLKKRDT